MNKPMKKCNPLVLASTILTAWLLMAMFIIPNASCNKATHNGLHQNVGFYIAEMRLNVDQPLVSAESQGIVVTIRTAAAGYNSIILRIDFAGLENIEMYMSNYILQEKFYNRFIDNNELSISLEDGENLRYRRQLTDIAIKNDGSCSGVFEVIGKIKKTQTVKMNISKILDTQGEWNLEFELSYRPAKIYEIHEEFDLRTCRILIKDIIIDSFSTQIEFTRKSSVTSEIGFYDHHFRFDKYPPELKKLNSGVISHYWTDTDDTSRFIYCTQAPVPDDVVISIQTALTLPFDERIKYTINLKDYEYYFG
jgi:hypothetical protein